MQKKIPQIVDIDNIRCFINIVTAFKLFELLLMILNFLKIIMSLSADDLRLKCKKSFKRNIKRDDLNQIFSYFYWYL